MIHLEVFINLFYAMKLLLSVVLLIVFYDAGFAQTFNETIDWINTRGEENLKNITGKSSLYWELDRNGTLKITDYKPEDEEEVAKQFIYLNLYDLDSREALITTLEGSGPQLTLKCATEKYSCIKSRYYFEHSNSRTEAFTSYSFNLQNEYDDGKGRKLEQLLITAVRLFRKDSD